MSEDRAFGCLFCATGKEQEIAETLSFLLPDVTALSARQEKFKSVNGKKSKVQAIVLPSYVFFTAPGDLRDFRKFRINGVLKILTQNDEGYVWQLSGQDEAFARWLFRYNGLLEFSKACQEGSRIRIISGPLKDMEGEIRRIDKRGHSGQVALNFGGKQVLAWLGFDLIEPEEKELVPK